MDSITYKPQILETFENVRNFSFEEKKEAVMDETKMNKFLDRIIDFKKSLKIKTDKIEEIIESSEKITWFNHLDDDSLLIVNDLVSSIRNLHSSLHIQYISLQYIQEKGIAKVEMENFISAIDDLKEIANDLIGGKKVFKFFVFVFKNKTMKEMKN